VPSRIINEHVGWGYAIYMHKGKLLSTLQVRKQSYLFTYLFLYTEAPPTCLMLHMFSE